MAFNSGHRSLIISTTASFFMWGIIGTIAPLSLSFPFLVSVPRLVSSEILSVGPIFIMLGNVLMGIVADRIGRKKVFIVTMISYGLGVILITIAFSVPLLILGLVLSEFGVGGEEPTGLAIIAEDFPAETRSKFLTLVANFDNIGSAFISGIFIVESTLSIYLHPYLTALFGSLSSEGDLTFRFILLVSAAVLIVIMVYSRIKMPESYRWLQSKGRNREAAHEKAMLGIMDSEASMPMVPFRVTLPILMTMGISQYLTFGLMAYIVGPYEFPSETPTLTFVAMVGASAAGFLAMYLINRERRIYTLASFLGGTITIAVILGLASHLSSLVVFLPLLFLNMMFSEFAWASRTTLEPELVPTRIRSSAIGIIRLAPMIGYAISVYLTASLNLSQFLYYNLGLWVLGLGSAVAWFLLGYETRNVNIDYGT